MQGALGGLEHGLADILVQVIDIAINDDARLLPECQHGIVAERDLVPSTQVRSSSLQLDKRLVSPETTFAPFSTLSTMPTAVGSSAAWATTEKPMIKSKANWRKGPGACLTALR